jgi:hypothetical protein
VRFKSTLAAILAEVAAHRGVSRTDVETELFITNALPAFDSARPQSAVRVA